MSRLAGIRAFDRAVPGSGRRTASAQPSAALSAALLHGSAVGAVGSAGIGGQTLFCPGSRHAIQGDCHVNLGRTSWGIALLPRASGRVLRTPLLMPDIKCLGPDHAICVGCQEMPTWILMRLIDKSNSLCSDLVASGCSAEAPSRAGCLANAC
jgi:hypothetical protein